MTRGFYIDSLELTGRDRNPAILKFRDCLSVVSGASDTGKSYALSCIDFALGSSTQPREIKEAVGYEVVHLGITMRQGERRFRISRSLAGGDVEVETQTKDGTRINKEVLRVTHSSGAVDTLPALLLKLTGLEGRRIRVNANGETQSLGFRSLSFLCIVDEERIISARPPHLSGDKIFETREEDALRMLITGVESPPVYKVPTKVKQSASSQRSLLLQMIDDRRLELKALGVTEEFVDIELEEIEDARERALSQYDDARGSVVILEGEQRKAAQSIREAQSRLIVVRGLLQRFELLSKHYDSDLDRLALVEQSGILLEAFPATTCVVCGSAPEHHRPEECEKAFNMSAVRQAARAEIIKVQRLKLDLDKELSAITEEAAGIEQDIETNKNRLAGIESKIEHELMPRVRMTTDSMNANVSRRDLLLRAKGISDHIRELSRRESQLTPKALKASLPTSVVSSAPSTAMMVEFAAQVEGLLAAWNYPDKGRVVYADQTRDLVIGNQTRNSHGKGVRALTCSAFMIGLMHHCLAKGQPHPSFVVLDSPLVAYRPPDANSKPDPENLALQLAGVKEAFYSTLAKTKERGQVIVFENDDPPESLWEEIGYTHFSKSDVGRHGFFPPVQD